MAPSTTRLEEVITNGRAPMTMSSKDQRPGRRIAGSIIEGRDLSRLIGIPEDELVRMANQAHLPFSFSANVGVWHGRRLREAIEDNY
jgi:hypothetical protein